GGAAHILSRLERPPAAGTRLPAGVQLIAFEIEVGSHQLFFEFLGFLSRLGISFRQGNALRWGVSGWVLLFSHCLPAPCRRHLSVSSVPVNGRCGWSHLMVKDAPNAGNALTRPGGIRGRPADRENLVCCRSQP